MDTIAKNLAAIQAQIHSAEQQFHRPLGSAQLLAVSKRQTVAAIQQAVDAGQKLFAENYLQEALIKIKALADQKLEWHFIGAIQANKTRALAENFHWIHSVDRLDIAKRLNDQRPADLPPLNICLQVNIDDESQKAGADPKDLLLLVEEITQLPRLTLRGLMVIPKPQKKFDEQRESFQKLRTILETLQLKNFNLDTLSMGMSHDFTAAIAEGATIVRIGTAIFGGRIIS